jgi:hypothetical protein
MYQSYFKLHLDKYEHIKALENKMGHAYARLRLTLYRDDYKRHFKGIDASDVEAITRAKDVVRKTLPLGFGFGQWKLICDLFDEKSWKVNIYYYTD